MPRWQLGLAAVWMGQFLSVSGFSMMVPFLPLYLLTFGMTDVGEVALWTGLIVGAAPLFAGLSAPLWGALGDKLGHKPMVVRAQLAGGFTVALMAAATNPPLLVLLRAVQGGFGGNAGPTAALAASLAPSNRVSTALGATQMAVFLGGIVGPLAGGLLAEALGYRGTFLVTATCLGLAALCVWLLVPAAPRPSSAGAREKTSFRSVLTPHLMIAAGLSAATQLASGLSQPVLPLMVQEFGGGSVPATVGLLYGATAASSALSAVIAGRLGDSISARVIVPICLFGAGLLFLPQAFAGDSNALLVSRFAMGLFIGGAQPAVNVVAARLGGEANRASAIGVVQMFGLIGLAAGPVLGAALAATVDLRSPLVLTAGMLLLAAVLGAMYLRTPRQKGY